MAKCGYTWKNKDPEAKRGPNGNKIHPFHECFIDPHGLTDHKCQCGVTLPKLGRNR